MDSTIWGSILAVVSIIFASYFRAQVLDLFFIDLGIHFDIILIVRWYLFPFAHAICKTIENHCYNDFTCFCISEKHDFWRFPWFVSLPVLALVVDDLGYRFGSDVGNWLILLFQLIQHRCVHRCWIIYDTNMAPNIDFSGNRFRHKTKQLATLSSIFSKCF